MHPVMASRHRSSGGGGGGGFTYSFIGATNSPSTSSLAVPTGTQVGDLVVLYITNGGSGSPSTLSGWTNILSVGPTAVYYKIYASGDVISFTANFYIGISVFRKSTGTPVVDSYNTTTYTTTIAVNTAFPSLTPTTANDAAMSIMLSQYSATTGNLIAGSTTGIVDVAGGVSGSFTCGMAADHNILTTTSAYYLEAPAATATSAYKVTLTTMLFK